MCAGKFSFHSVKPILTDGRKSASVDDLRTKGYVVPYSCRPPVSSISKNLGRLIFCQAGCFMQQLPRINAGSTAAERSTLFSMLLWSASSGPSLCPLRDLPKTRMPAITAPPSSNSDGVFRTDKKPICSDAIPLRVTRRPRTGDRTVTK
ncbi:hypothetical protein PHET_09933 [Paragonimus heterotremus]|uniref:Uncharacterized protein n=1 Tax=Paragonimus heterotremus TaxID=100268 RepID=A0A8J4SLN7_9TREM|nr:hypothetical protein PHET_09933 [Paragonimus heterotremus]